MGCTEVQIFLVPISESYSENEVLKSRYSLDRKGALGTCHCSRIIPCVPGRKALESNRHLYPLRPPRPRRYDQRRGSTSSHCLNILCCFFQEKSNMHSTSVQRCGNEAEKLMYTGILEWKLSFPGHSRRSSHLEWGMAMPSDLNDLGTGRIQLQALARH